MAAADDRLALAFVSAHPDDAARLLDRQDAADVAVVLAAAPAAHAAALFRMLGPSVAGASAELLADATLAPILAALPLDALVSIVRRTAPERRAQLIARLPEDQRMHLATALQFPQDSAAAIADPFVLALADDLTAGDAQRQLKGSRHAYHYLYVVTRDGTLVGALAVHELLSARPRQALASIMRREPVRVGAFTDLATVAVHPAWRDLDALPVVDDGRRLIGAIRHKTVRHLQLEGGPPMVETIVRLSEMYWAGLSGILTSIAPASGYVGADEKEDNKHVT